MYALHGHPPVQRLGDGRLRPSPISLTGADRCPGCPATGPLTCCFTSLNLEFLIWKVGCSHRAHSRCSATVSYLWPPPAHQLRELKPCPFPAQTVGNLLFGACLPSNMGVPSARTELHTSQTPSSPTLRCTQEGGRHPAGFRRWAPLVHAHGRGKRGPRIAKAGREWSVGRRRRAAFPAVAQVPRTLSAGAQAPGARVVPL